MALCEWRTEDAAGALIGEPGEMREKSRPIYTSFDKFEGFADDANVQRRRFKCSCAAAVFRVLLF